MEPSQPADPADERVVNRADELSAEELAAGSEDPVAQAAAILGDSDLRSADRNAAPDSVVEHRTSEQATPPPD